MYTFKVFMLPKVFFSNTIYIYHGNNIHTAIGYWLSGVGRTDGRTDLPCGRATKRKRGVLNGITCDTANIHMHKIKKKGTVKNAPPPGINCHSQPTAPGNKSKTIKPAKKLNETGMD